MSGTCYSASYMSQTCNQKHFTISEVAADWHELMIPQRNMRPSIASICSKQLDPRLQLADIPPPQSATLGLHSIARKLLLISRPTEGRRLSWSDQDFCQDQYQVCFSRSRLIFCPQGVLRPRPWSQGLQHCISLWGLLIFEILFSSFKNGLSKLVSKIRL